MFGLVSEKHIGVLVQTVGFNRDASWSALSGQPTKLSSTTQGPQFSIQGFPEACFKPTPHSPVPEPSSSFSGNRGLSCACSLAQHPPSVVSNIESVVDMMAIDSPLSCLPSVDGTLSVFSTGYSSSLPLQPGNIGVFLSSKHLPVH